MGESTKIVSYVIQPDGNFSHCDYLISSQIVNIPELITFFSICSFLLIRAYLNIIRSFSHTLTFIAFKFLRVNKYTLSYNPYCTTFSICWHKNSFEYFYVPLGKFSMSFAVNVMALMCSKLNLVMWKFHNKSQFVCFQIRMSDGNEERRWSLKHFTRAWQRMNERTN